MDVRARGGGPVSKSRLVVIVGCIAIPTMIPTSAQAVSCRYNPLADGITFPGVHALRTQHAGCKTARSVAHEIVLHMDAFNRLPRTVVARDYRDDDRVLGRFRCRYRLVRPPLDEGVHMRAVCRDGRRLVTMKLTT